MYRKNQSKQGYFDFHLPFGGKLRSHNRWVILADLIPWDQIDETYSKHFENSRNGCPGKPARVALGALIIKERLGTTDRETVEQIRENPYLQYFLGFSSYQDKEPFHHTSMVHFRKRFTQEKLAEINEMIIQKANAKDPESQGTTCDKDHSNDPPSTPPNHGKLIIDATCTPADITYPTDIKLLNEAREKSEKMIDMMHREFVGLRAKPRTYRQLARKAYLALAKQKTPSKKAIRKAIGRQLRYLKRNLKIIDRMAQEGLLRHLDDRFYKLLLVIHELYRQQSWLYETRSKSISDRIVSIYQPHVRPIVRGKVQSSTEFGAKISVSLVDGLSVVETLSWDAYNEGTELKTQIQAYVRRYGFYPESVHVDKIYRNQANRRYCKKHGIRLSGPTLGRPKAMTEANAQELKSAKQQQKQDELERNAIEGKFGQGKRRFTLNRIMAKLAVTSEAVIWVSFMVMNLEKLLRDVFLFVCVVWNWIGIGIFDSLSFCQDNRKTEVEKIIASRNICE